MTSALQNTQLREREEEPSKQVREGGKNSIMALCTLDKLEAERQRQEDS